MKLVKDINGHPNIIGDGINVAQRIMSFARPGQIVVSRSYYDVVSNLASEYAKLFQYEGSRTDKHVREHEIYVVGHHEGAIQKARAGMKDRASDHEPQRDAPDDARPAPGTNTVTLTIPRFVQDKKKLTMLAGGLGLAGAHPRRPGRDEEIAARTRGRRRGRPRRCAAAVEVAEAGRAAEARGPGRRSAPSPPSARPRCRAARREGPRARAARPP